MNISTRLFLTLLSCLYFLCACGLPEHLGMDSIIVEMDGFTYRGNLDVMIDEEVPHWMQPHDPRHVVDDYVFIRTKEGWHYECDLTRTRRPSVAGPGPESADIRIDVDIYYTAVGFKKYPMPTVVHEPWDHHFPPSNHIYITKAGGPIYFAPLKEYTPIPRVAILHGR